MVTLNDNTVLVIGGEDGGRFVYNPGQSPFTVYTSCEIFHPATRNWTSAGAMATPRYLHRAALLPSGKVLVAGGYTSGAGNEVGLTASAEIYDPATGKWTPTSDMPIARSIQEMFTLPSGLVFVGGGVVQVAGAVYGEVANDTVIYNPHTGTWTNGTHLLFDNENDYYRPTGVLYRH